MNIVYNCDENYIKYASVSIVSLLENNRDCMELRIYMLDNGIHEESRKRLRQTVLSYGPGRDIVYIDISDIEGRILERSGKGLEPGRFGFTAFGRLFAPELIDEDRLLYIDSDTVINGELSPVFELELSSPYIAAMAPEPTIYPQVRKRLGIPEKEPYFNSGVILMDAAAWRREEILSLALDYMKSCGGELEFPDQDILNVILRGRTRPLSQTYDFFSGYYYRSYNDLCRLYPGYGENESREGLEAAKRQPVLVHFAGDERPWIAGSRSPYLELYRRYRELSPWKDEPDVEGHRLYMLFYHVVNLVTRMAPGLRRFISEIYYRKRFSKDRD